MASKTNNSKKYNVWVMLLKDKRDRLVKKNVTYTTAQKWVKKYDSQGIGAYMIDATI